MAAKRKLIWIVNEYSLPLQKRTRQIALSQHLTELGYHVLIVCGSSVRGSKDNLIENDKRFMYKKYDGADFLIIRTRNYSGNSVKRVLVALEFQFLLYMVSKKVQKPDVIVSDFAGLFGYIFLKFKRKYKTKIIYDVLDLWPEDFIDMGYLQRNSVLAKVLYGMEHKSYKEANSVIFSFEGGKDYIIEKGWDTGSGGDIDINKIGYLNNGVDLETFDKQKTSIILEDPDLDSDLFKAVYLGSINKANEIGLLVRTAKVLQERATTGIIILIYGDGDFKLLLEEEVKTCGLMNIKFKGRLPIEYAPNMLSRCDLNLFNFVNAPFIRFGISPNKLFMYFASGKPILSTISPKYDLVRNRKCGLITRNTAESIATAITTFRNMDKSEYDSYCSNCRSVAEEYDYKKLVSVLVEKIES